MEAECRMTYRFSETLIMCAADSRRGLINVQQATTILMNGTVNDKKRKSARATHVHIGHHLFGGDGGLVAADHSFVDVRV